MQQRILPSPSDCRVPPLNSKESPSKFKLTAGMPRKCSMKSRRILLIITAVSAVPAAASAHGVTVNVDLNAAGTKLILDRPVYADRDVTAITNLDQSLGYDQDDDVPGFEFSSNVLGSGGV